MAKGRDWRDRVLAVPCILCRGRDDARATTRLGDGSGPYGDAIPPMTARSIKRLGSRADARNPSRCPRERPRQLRRENIPRRGSILTRYSLEKAKPAALRARKTQPQTTGQLFERRSCGPIGNNKERTAAARRGAPRVQSARTAQPLRVASAS